MKASLMLRLFEQLISYLKAQGITKLIYKAIPHIYHSLPAEEDLYALFRFNARLIRRDASAAILLENKLRFGKKRQQRIKLAKRNGLVVTKSNDFTTFMLTLKELLQSKYNVNPTHSEHEMNLLARRFPDNIKLFAVYENDKMLSGVVTYESQNVLHAQYQAYTEEGQDVGASDLIFDYLINDYSSNKKFFDFGISTEQDGRYLNTGLATYKERFGARTVTYDFYEIAPTREG
jgi:hypothetical protein